MPQQYIGSEFNGCFTGTGDLCDSNFFPTYSEHQKEPEDSNLSIQNIPSNCYLQQKIEISNAAYYNDRLYSNYFSRKRFICCSYDQSNCLNSNENEYLNQACRFYVNNIIPLNIHKHSFLVSC